LRSVKKFGILWFSLDDMDYVQGEALSLMKSAMEEAREPTVILAVCGGPELRQNLASEHSPIIRFFTGSDFDLGNFTLEETTEALELPTRANQMDVKWTHEAVKEVHRWTGGYPYLIQCLAYAAFREGVIDKSAVEGALAKALGMAGTWMEREITGSDPRLQSMHSLMVATLDSNHDQ
jgi:hypothetical protein